MFVREAARERPTHVMSRTLVQDGWWMGWHRNLRRKKWKIPRSLTLMAESRQGPGGKRSTKTLLAEICNKIRPKTSKVFQAVGSEREPKSERRAAIVVSCRVLPSTQASAQPTAVQRIWVVGITVTFFFPDPFLSGETQASRIQEPRDGRCCVAEEVERQCRRVSSEPGTTPDVLCVLQK